MSSPMPLDQNGRMYSKKILEMEEEKKKKKKKEDEGITEELLDGVIKMLNAIKRSL